MKKKDGLHSIIILMPYFGEWPFWIDLFFESCKRNPTVNWHFLSDCGKLDTFPDNVTYQEISFKDYTLLVSNRLSINFDPKNAYKICDIRPAFGAIHEDIIKEYDFWGFGDLDLVYGDLRTLYNKEHLGKHDLYSNHATRISGHLCLIRNTEEMRNVFKKIPQWEEKFTNNQHLAVDEKAFSKLFVKHKNFPRKLRKLFNVFYPLSRKSYFVESYTTPNGCIAWRDGSYKFPKRWYWSNGSIKNDLDDESYYPYFHFAVWKKNDWIGNEFDRLENFDPNSIYEFSSGGIRAVRYSE